MDRWLDADDSGGAVSSRDDHGIGRFVLSLLAILVVAIGVPIGLLAVSRARFGSSNPLAGVDPPWRWFGDGMGSLSDPIADDTFLDALIRSSICVIWAAVAVIVTTTAIEVIHRVRHRGIRAPDLRGLGWAQRVARFIAVGLLVVVPAMSAAPSIATSLPNTIGPRVTEPVAQAMRPSLDERPAGGGVVARTERRGDGTAAHDAPIGSHRVRSGESVYSIAEGLAAGSDHSTMEIAEAILDANLGAVMGPGERFSNPAYIQAGWTLDIPDRFTRNTRHHGVESPASDPADPSVSDDIDTTYVVRPGDTLWDIAGEQLGDPMKWQDLWSANAGAHMGNGLTFDDPNLILPGWQLELPDRTRDITTVVAPDAMPANAGPDDAAPADHDADDTEPADAAPDDDGADNSGPAEATPVDDGHVDDAYVDDAHVDDAAIDDDDLSAPQPPSAATVDGAPTSTTPPPAAAAVDGTSTSTTTPPTAASPDAQDATGDPVGPSAPQAPAPIRLEHAALLAAGILALVGVRRRQRLRAARPRHRVPEPRPEVVETERRLRAVDAGERALRVDVASRAAAWSLAETTAQIGWVEVSVDGDVELRLTAPATLPAPWTGHGQSWRLGAEVPIELLSEDARRVGLPCVAFVQVGVTPAGGELLADLEACGTLAVEANAQQADEVVAAIAAGLASSLFAEVAHLIAVSLPESALLGHRNAHGVDSPDAAFDLAMSLVGTTVVNERSTFSLRSLRTGGEMWEPAIVMLTAADDAAAVCSRSVPEPGHGVGIVIATRPGELADAPTRVVATAAGWSFEGFGSSIEFTPIGLSTSDLAEVDHVLADAERELESMEPASAREVTVPFEPMPYEIVVGLLGGVSVIDRDGNSGRFERSKTVELIAWLVTHRDRSTRTGARTALWEMDVRDATFANVVSEARRSLARLVAPPIGEEWVARTLTEQLPVHDAVVTDAQLVEQRLEFARLQPPAHAVEVLRPAVAMIRDMPFAGTSYLWPDAEGITSNLVLLAITAATEFAGHALSLGDTDGVFWATGHGLQVLPGHEDLIGLRMQAHARSGDLAGVRNEWEAYERVLVADAWSDGEPSPKLRDLRRDLLSL